MKRVLIVDDSLDVFPVHGSGGTIAAGVFAAKELGGVGLGAGVTMLHQLGVQTIGVVATLAWCAAVTYGILKAIDVTIGLRVAAEEETEGLDLADHGERACIL